MGYTATIATRQGNQVRIVINKGSGELLLAGDNPISIQYECDSLFKPLKMSACTVNILTKEPLLDLYTGKLTEVTIHVYKKVGTAAEQLIWFGYLTPNVYSSAYNDEYDELSLEFVDPLSAMDSVKFKKSQNDTWKTFAELINGAISAIGASSVMSADITTAATVIATTVGCLEQNFIDETADEDEGAMTWQAVLEEVCKYMNVQAMCYGNKIYLKDVTETSTLIDLQMVANDAQIALGNTYNKATVVANMNPIEDISPDMVDVGKNNLKCVNATSGDHETYNHASGTSSPGVVILDSFYQYDDDNLEMHTVGSSPFMWTRADGSNYGKDKIGGYTGGSNQDGRYPPNMSGVYIQRVAHYDSDEGTPANLSWLNILTLTTQGDRAKINSGIFAGTGYFILSLKWMNIPKPEAQGPNTVPYYYQIPEKATAFTDTILRVWVKCGDMYYTRLNGWSKTAGYIEITKTYSADDQYYNNEFAIDNEVVWYANLDSDQEGMLIPLQSFMYGKVTVEVQSMGSIIRGITELKLTYAKRNTDGVVWGREDADKDLTYTNVIDAGNVEQADDMEMRINTYSNQQSSYSYALTTGPDYYQPQTSPEERLLTRVVNHYKEPRLQFSGTVNDSGIKPYDRMRVPAFSSRGNMAILGITYDLAADEAQVELKEIGTL